MSHEAASDVTERDTLLEQAEWQHEDLALLRRFEPVIRYTRGEQFFPLDVERYVRRCSLWVHRPDRPPRRIVNRGEMTMRKLVEPRKHGFGATYYLKFADDLRVADMAAWIQRNLNRDEERESFKAGRGRLARVGYGPRLIDALFSLTLLARGRVPGSTALVSSLTYEKILEEKEEYRYYGRIVRRNGWTVLQYWFFYPFNNWRSGFFGVNDHEADWENVCIYLAEDEQGTLQPEWVAYSEHDYEGDDLRRHWQDPEVEKIGDHPVVYAGAGSHACYYQQGEYLSEVSLPFLSPLLRFGSWTQRRWWGLVGKVDREEQEEAQESLANLVRVPFVDYARGDGRSIGPRTDRPWDPVLLEPVPEWVAAYRGLWGLYAQDPIAGENAPAGPMYNRDGTVRASWYDPLAWAGLGKVPPPNTAVAQLRDRQAKLLDYCQQLAEDVSEQRERLNGLYLEAQAMRGEPHLKAVYDDHQEQIETLSEELDENQAELTRSYALLEAMGRYEMGLVRGERGGLRAHIHRAVRPTDDEEMELGRFAEAWAAMSIALMMFGVIGLIVFSETFPIYGVLSLVGLLIFIEAIFRRQLSLLINNLAIILSVVAFSILTVEFFWEGIVVAVLAAGTFIMWENLRELWT